MKKEKGPTENIFISAKEMLLESIGRLPTSLVMILLLSATMAALTGLLLVLHQPQSRSTEFMPLRLEASENAQPANIKEMQGTWVYQTTTYAMSLTLVGDRFELIIAIGDIGEAQFYVRGNFRIVGDVMVLGARPDLGKPYDPSRPWIKYLPIGMTDLNTKFSLSQKRLMWDVPLSEQDSIVGQPSVIFTGHEDGHFVWTRAEE